MKVIRLMNPPGGPAVRMLAGFALIAVGWLIGWPGGVAVALVDLVPLTAGLPGPASRRRCPGPRCVRADRRR